MAIVLRRRFEQVYQWKDEGRGWGTPCFWDEEDCARAGEFRLSTQVRLRDSLAYIGVKSVQVLAIVGSIALKSTFSVDALGFDLERTPYVRFACMVSGVTYDLVLFRVTLSKFFAYLEYRVPGDPGILSGANLVHWADLAVARLVVDFETGDEGIDKECRHPAALAAKFESWVRTSPKGIADPDDQELLVELRGYCASTLCGAYRRAPKQRDMDDPMEGESHYKLLKLKGRVTWDVRDRGLYLFIGWMFDLSLDPLDVTDEVGVIDRRVALIKLKKLDTTALVEALLLVETTCSTCSHYGEEVNDVWDLRMLKPKEIATVAAERKFIGDRPEVGKLTELGRVAKTPEFGAFKLEPVLKFCCNRHKTAKIFDLADLVHDINGVTSGVLTRKTKPTQSNAGTGRKRSQRGARGRSAKGKDPAE